MSPSFSRRITALCSRKSQRLPRGWKEVEEQGTALYAALVVLSHEGALANRRVIVALRQRYGRGARAIRRTLRRSYYRSFAPPNRLVLLA
jgi:hypothetical protein